MVSRRLIHANPINIMPVKPVLLEIWCTRSYWIGQFEDGLKIIHRHMQMVNPPIPWMGVSIQSGHLTPIWGGAHREIMAANLGYSIAPRAEKPPRKPLPDWRW